MKKLILLFLCMFISINLAHGQTQEQQARFNAADQNNAALFDLNKNELNAYAASNEARFKRVIATHIRVGDLTPKMLALANPDDVRQIPALHAATYFKDKLPVAAGKAVNAYTVQNPNELHLFLAAFSHPGTRVNVEAGAEVGLLDAEKGRYLLHTHGGKSILMDENRPIEVDIKKDHKVFVGFGGSKIELRDATVLRKYGFHDGQSANPFFEVAGVTNKMGFGFHGVQISSSSDVRQIFEADSCPNSYCVAYDTDSATMTVSKQKPNYYAGFYPGAPALTLTIDPNAGIKKIVFVTPPSNPDEIFEAARFISENKGTPLVREANRLEAIHKAESGAVVVLSSGTVDVKEYISVSPGWFYSKVFAPEIQSCDSSGKCVSLSGPKVAVDESGARSWVGTVIDAVTGLFKRR